MHNGKSLISLSLSASINRTFILAGDWARGYHSLKLRHFPNNPKILSFKVRLSRLRKFCQIKLFPSLVQKIPSFVCLVFKIENE